MRRRGHGLKVARRATALTFLVLLALAGRAQVEWFRGSTTATTVAGAVPLADPLAALEATAATRELQPDLMVGAAALLAFAAVMGPVFCSWVCPVGLVLELNQALRARVLALLRRRARGSARPALPEWSLPAHTRTAVLGGVLGFAVVAQLPLFQAVSPIHMAGLAVAFGGGPVLAVFAVLAAVEWVAPRLWCRALCPLGETYALAGRLAPFRVHVVLAEAGKVRCEACSRHCPMGIRVMEDYALRARRSVTDPGCTRCGACVDACPRGVLRLGLRDPNPAAACGGQLRDHSLEVPA